MAVDGGTLELSVVPECSDSRCCLLGKGAACSNCSHGSKKTPDAVCAPQAPFRGRFPQIAWRFDRQAELGANPPRVEVPGYSRWKSSEEDSANQVLRKWRDQRRGGAPSDPDFEKFGSSQSSRTCSGCTTPAFRPLIPGHPHIPFSYRKNALPANHLLTLKRLKARAEAVSDHSFSRLPCDLERNNSRRCTAVFRASRNELKFVQQLPR